MTKELVDGSGGYLNTYPQTRFQGSKARILPWIHSIISTQTYATVLDLFSGSGVASYYFKKQGKTVASNDILASSAITSKAFIDNNHEKIDEVLLSQLLDLPSYKDHPHHIEEIYDGFYFTQDENVWLDGMIHNIRNMSNHFQQAMAYWALFQACIIKRPYNLFHRKNLDMRLRQVKRSFGNKKTWDTPFPTHYRQFITSANNAIFNNGNHHTVLQEDAINLHGDYDLVYLDPPYFKANSTQSTNYQDYYHFLEGILHYHELPNSINTSKKHLPLNFVPSLWTKKEQIISQFDKIFNNFPDSIIVVSYNTEGYPSPEDLQSHLEQYRNQVDIHYQTIKYVLKKKQSISTEVLLVAK